MDHLDVKIVAGKRYLSAKINENSIEYWQWNSGFIRAIELADNACSTSPPTLDYNTLLLEDTSGSKCWSNVEQDHDLFLVEERLVSIRYKNNDYQPALVYAAVKQHSSYDKEASVVLYLLNQEKKDFVLPSHVYDYKSEDYPAAHASVVQWLARREDQCTLTSNPCRLVGSRVRVHSDPLVYTACVTSANNQDGCLMLTDDKVLGEHEEYAIQVHVEVLQLGSVLVDISDIGIKWSTVVPEPLPCLNCYRIIIKMKFDSKY